MRCTCPLSPPPLAWDVGPEQLCKAGPALTEHVIATCVCYLPVFRFLNPTPGAYEAAMRTLLEEWDWDAILPCHGDIVKSGGKALLRRHLGRS